VSADEKGTELLYEVIDPADKGWPKIVSAELYENCFVRYGKDWLLFIGLEICGRREHALHERVEIGDETCLNVNKKVTDNKKGDSC
jgi:hypothetical protein